MTYQQKASGSSERYTPKQIVDAARVVMGGTIHLDPTSCSVANEIVGALGYYTKEQDSYNRDWITPSVWFNPPYGKSEPVRLNKWVQKILSEYEKGNVGQACVILPAFTAQKWFQPLWQYPICFLSKRVKFIDGASGMPLAQPMYGHCVVWLPPFRESWGADDADKMARAFEGLGVVTIGVHL